MRIWGFTGTQKGMTDLQQQALLWLLEQRSGEFHHGMCIGADEQASAIARYAGNYILVGHPPTNPNKMSTKSLTDKQQDPFAYMTRNEHIVAACDALIAAPYSAERDIPRSGTWATVRRARKAGKPVILLEP
jgi:hypothetical protein